MCDVKTLERTYERQRAHDKAPNESPGLRLLRQTRFDDVSCLSRNWRTPPSGLFLSRVSDGGVFTSRERRSFTGAEKIAVLREHLIEKVPVGPAGPLAGGLGRAGHLATGEPPWRPGLRARVPAGGLPPADLHDAGPRRGGGQPLERVPGADPGSPRRPGNARPRARAPACSIRRRPTRTGRWTSGPSTSAGRSTTRALDK